MSAAPIRVLLVDDEPLVRAGLRAILAAEPDVEVVGEAEDGVGLPALVGSTGADVVLMDVRMPGWTASRRRRRCSPASPRCGCWW